ncbi:MAG TPA: hypothetical protein VM734_01855 [Kofleriaceae bacterium]|nr:hypothetical protein [Kofleriaceae bacterium]
MAPPTPPPPRLYAITATAAPIAAVIARTSGWFLVARWHLDTGKVEPGAWLEGKLYPRRCDVSPDGKLLYYFAMKGGRPFHAVSWLPWLTALALWRDDSTYTRGGYFQHVPARGGKRDGFLSMPPDQGDAAPLLERHRLQLRSHDVVSYAVERIRGWREHETCPPRARTDSWDERRAPILYRPNPTDDALRLVLTDVGISRAVGNIEQRKPYYHLERAGEVTALPGVTWADWDRRGRLLAATDRGTLEIRNPDTGKTVASHDLTDLRPDPQPSPPRVRKW